MVPTQWKKTRLPLENSRQLGMAAATLSAMAFLSALSLPAKSALIERNVNVTLNARNIESYNLDVDLNGTTDFTFTAALVLDPVVSVGFDVVDFPFGGNNGVVIDMATSDGFPTVSRLAVGNLISAANIFSNGSFEQGNLFFFTSFDPPSGNFEGNTGFLGLRFDGTGGPLFGFAEITVDSLNTVNNPLGLSIGRVGYNNVPGQSVQIAAAVPEPGTLPAVLGGLGLLAAFRRRKANATTAGQEAVFGIAYSQQC